MKKETMMTTKEFQEIMSELVKVVNENEWCSMTYYINEEGDYEGFTFSLHRTEVPTRLLDTPYESIEVKKYDGFNTLDFEWCLRDCHGAVAKRIALYAFFNE